MATFHPETNFAANLVRYIMRSHGNAWARDPELDGVSPDFTPMVQAAVDSILRSQRKRILKMFNDLFGDLDSAETEQQVTERQVSEQQFIDAVECIRTLHSQNGFHTDSFLSFCCWVSEFAGLAVPRGFQDAPNRAFVLIIQEVQDARRSGQLVSHFWNDIQNIAFTLDTLSSTRG